MLQNHLETYILGRQIFEALEVFCKYWCYLTLGLFIILVPSQYKRNIL